MDVLKTVEPLITPWLLGILPWDGQVTPPAIRPPLRSADSAASAPATRQGAGRGVLPAENAEVSETSMIYLNIPDATCMEYLPTFGPVWW